MDVICSQVDAGATDGDWPETLQRISFVLGIYAALHTLFPDQQQADGWIRRPNAGAPFKGEPALALMCTGGLGDLEIVREYLDGEGTSQPSSTEPGAALLRYSAASHCMEELLRKLDR
jgi:hypothetical protein